MSEVVVLKGFREEGRGKSVRGANVYDLPDQG
jgi:hypothetical protein